MTKIEFKNKVLKWLKENNIEPNKIKSYNHKRYGYEVRFYEEPMKLLNSKRSFRETSREEKDGKIIKHGFSGIFNRKISTYIYINEENFNNKEGREFTLEMFKDFKNKK